MNKPAGLLIPLFLSGVTAMPAFAQPTVLVGEGSSMVYLANYADPGPIDWTAEMFPDGAWMGGSYGVGYDTPAGSNPLITTNVTGGAASIFTRAEFTIADVNAVTNLFLRADWDDGYAAWINGMEVYRSTQMPPAPGALLWNTPASLHESSNNTPPSFGELIEVSDAIPLLHNGTNVLAIGVWNGTLPSSDLVLVPEFTMNVSVDPRGPYLQLGTDTGMIVRWRTAAATDSRVEFTPEGGATVTVDDPVVTTEHVVPLTGLTPDTKHFYTVGSTTAVVAGGDAGHFFRTAPVPGTRQPIRVWALGDSGTANANAEAVRDAYEVFAGSRYTDVWLMLGDNAYPIGTDEQYQAAVYDMYPGTLRQSPLWATLGNHDGVTSHSLPFPPYGPYYNMFSFPTAAEAGGEASGTEAYYSFDYGNIHFVCLNSQDVDRTPAGAMLQWLEWDLMNTTQDWIIAFWHHPPYSMGSHNSDDPLDSGGRLFDMRENALPILEDWGVDLVLTGHSHSYERSILLDGHYDVSDTLVSTMKLDQGDGRIDGDGAYQKLGAGPAAHQGAVHIVGGSSGQISGGSLDHPAMFVSWNLLGSVVLDVEGDRLQATFVTSTGAEPDHFTLVKNTGVPPQAEFAANPTAGIAPLSVDFTDLSSTNTAAWAWDLTADGTIESTEPSPAGIYPAPGTYSVRLTAANQSGSDTETKIAHICVAGSAAPAIDGLAYDTNGTDIVWPPAPGATAYDVVRGDLALLAASGGNFATVIEACVADNLPGPPVTDPPVPPPGSGFIYLVRSIGECGLMIGSYDSGGAGQSAPRDAGIAASLLACP